MLHNARLAGRTFMPEDGLDDQPTPVAEFTEARAALESAMFEIKRVIVGQEQMLERVFVALLAGGHVLLEGVPGLAKTLTVKTVAEVIGGTFHRIQFTPDLVPADLVGTRIYRPDSASFDTELGPVFCNILLADEINRAPAKVQSALLEVMQEHQVTIGKQTFTVGDPFLVLATQNPIESEGTYPLPEAQVDRFLMKVVVDYPEPAEEVSIVTRSLGNAAVIQEVLPIDRLHHFQKLTREVYVDRAVSEYAVRLANATRQPARFGLAQQAQYIAFGASPRGPISLVQAGRALALLRGRRYVLPQDVYDLAKDVLRHRIVLNYQALAEGVTSDRVLDAVIASIQLPRIDLADEVSA